MLHMKSHVTCCIYSTVDLRHLRPLKVSESRLRKIASWDNSFKGIKIDLSDLSQKYTPAFIQIVRKVMLNYVT